MTNYIFSVYDLFNESDPVQNEFLYKHLFINDFLDDLEFLTFNNDLSNHSIINKYNIKTKTIKHLDDIPLDGDIYFTFGNFVGFDLNYNYYKTGKIDPNNNFNNMILLKTFEKLNNFFNENDNLSLLQYMSDPMDLKFDNATILSPDGYNNGEYFPLYQYSNAKSETGSKIKLNKENKLIIGSTCYNKFRNDEFNKFILPIYEKEKNNEKYNFFISKYRNHFYTINNFIEFNKFYEEIEKSEFGIILSTYSRDIISSNKLSQYLHRDCIPLFVEGCDEKSNYIPENLLNKYTFKHGEDLIELINKLDYNECLNDWLDFKEYISDINSFNIINGVIKNYK